MAKLSELGLGNEQVGEAADFDALPEQLGGFPDPPQPGPFRFRLPTNLGNVWDKAEKKMADGTVKPRIKAKFDQDNPLVIVQSLAGKYDNEPFQTTISNVERRRRKDEGVPEASDMDFLFRDAFEEKTKPKTNQEYANTLIKHAGQEFGADISWSWSCNDQRNIRIRTEQDTVEEVEGQPGCGKRYYTKDVPKNEDGTYPLHITCAGEGCGADLRAFASLERFRP